MGLKGEGGKKGMIGSEIKTEWPKERNWEIREEEEKGQRRTIKG